MYGFLLANVNLCVYFTPKLSDIMRQYPSWHRKSQRAYKVNRFVIILQMIASLALSGVILYGIARIY